MATDLQRISAELAGMARETERHCETLEEFAEDEMRYSEGLRRQIRFTGRTQQSHDIATFLRGALGTWPGCPKVDAPRETGSGTVSFDAELCGRKFTVRIEPTE